MVSVILPFYNAAKTLKNAVDSVLRQTFKDFELILVNNNSTDESLQIAESYQFIDKRVVIGHEEKQGVAHAMNRGISVAKHEWIARMDADDEWFEMKLQKQIKYLLKRPDVGVLGTQVEFCSNLESEGLLQYVAWSNSIISKTDIDRTIFIESPIVNPSVIFKRALIDSFGNYLQEDIPEDYEMFLRWHSKGIKMEKLPEKLMNWNDSETRLTRTNESYSQDAFNNIKCKYLAKWLGENIAKKPAVWIWGAGRKTRKRVEVLRSYGVEIMGYIDLKAKITPKWKCIYFESISKKEQPFIISFVSNRGVREQIRQYLLAKQYQELKEFIIAS